MTTTSIRPTHDRSGIELLREIRSRGPGAVGIGGLLDMRMDRLEPGRVDFVLRTRPDFSNPMGTLHGGVAATMLDSAMACAVMSELPPGAAYTTVDLAVTYLRPVPLDGVELRAEGTTVHVGRRIATARGELRDADHRLIATATTTCQVFSPGRPDTQA